MSAHPSRFFRILLIVLITLWAVLPVAAAPLEERAWIEFEGKVWEPTISGVVRSNSFGPLNQVDLVTDLGMSAEKRFPQGTLKLRPGWKHLFTFSYLKMDYHGDNNIIRNFVFGGTTFSVTDRVISDLEMKMYEAAYRYDFLRIPFASLGLILQADYLDTTSRLQDTTASLDVTDRIKFPLPSAGGALRISPLSFLTLTGQATTLQATVSGIKAEFLDIRGTGTISITRLLGITGGYRKITVFASDPTSGDLVDLEWEGPFAAASLRF